MISARPQRFFIASLCIALSLVACSKKEGDYAADRTEPTAATSDIAASSVTVTSLASAPASSTDNLTLGNNIVNQQQTNATFANKKMVVSAKANFQVKDVQQSANQIEALAQQQGGYVATSEISNNARGRNSYPIGNYQRKELISYTRTATMLVRVPKTQVGAFLQQLQQYIAFLDSSQFSAKDVTLDIQKAQVEAQIQALKTAQINEQKADKATQSGNIDIANQAALSRQEQLYADLQRQQLEDEVSLSTIELSFYQPEKIREQIVEDIDGKMQSEKSVNFLPRLSDNLKAGWLYLVEFLLFLSQFWSFILAFGLLWRAWRWWLKRMPKHQSTLTKSAYRQAMPGHSSSENLPIHDGQKPNGVEQPPTNKPQSPD